MAPLQPIDVNSRRRKPGPERKPLEMLSYTFKPAISRPERTYSREKKREVLSYLYHHRVYDPCSAMKVRQGMTREPSDVYREPTYKEASTQFGIPGKTIANWWYKRDQVLEGNIPRYNPAWPKLEDSLYAAFLERRAHNRIVTVGWFRRTAKAMFKEMYPEISTQFTFSMGWWQRFRNRHDLVLRRITKQATRRPEEYVDYVNKFLQFIRRNSYTVLDPLRIESILMSPSRRFPQTRILNLDETPIPFEYLEGFTYEVRGVKTVAAKSDRSGWNKRQATLILYIFADGVQRLKPKVIFHGKPEGRVHREECDLYANGVTVEFNDTAYNNEQLFLKWIAEELSTLTEDGEEHLLVMDVAAFHKTETVLQSLRTKKVSVALIPPGLTSLLQPLDTAINRPFKDWLREETDNYVEQEEAKGKTVWSVSAKRIMITHVVAAAAQRLQERADMVRKSFIECGISVRPDGSQDHLIKIKDIAPSQINFAGWEKAEDTTVKSDFEELSLLFDHQLVGLASDDLTLSVSTLRKAELQQLCSLRKLPISGTKQQLVERLRSYGSNNRTELEADDVFN